MRINAAQGAEFVERIDATERVAIERNDSRTNTWPTRLDSTPTSLRPSRHPTTQQSPRRCSMSEHASPPPATINMACTILARSCNGSRSPCRAGAPRAHHPARDDQRTRQERGGRRGPRPCRRVPPWPKGRCCRSPRECPPGQVSGRFSKHQNRDHEGIAADGDRSAHQDPGTIRANVRCSGHRGRVA